jgi:hypothetical protein
MTAANKPELFQRDATTATESRNPPDWKGLRCCLMIALRKSAVGRRQ